MILFTLISFLVRGVNCVVSGTEWTIYNLVFCSRKKTEIQSSSWAKSEISKLVSSKTSIHSIIQKQFDTSRVAHSISDSSLLIFPLGNPHPALLDQPFTNRILSSLVLRRIAPQTGTRTPLIINYKKWIPL